METDKNKRESGRLAALDHLGAVRPEADHVLQELVNEVRSIFGTELCMVNLTLSEVQYFRAWSGDLPADLVETRQDPRGRSMCQYTVEAEMPFVVPDFLDTERFKDQFFCVHYGIRFYAGAPLITSGGQAIGTLCVLDTRPREFSEEQTRMLKAFARAVVGRLESLGALGREQSAKEREVRHKQELQRTLDASLDIIMTIGLDGMIKSINQASKTILGYEPEELVGRSFMDLVHPEDQDLWVEPTFAASEVQTERFENRCKRKDGNVSWIEWNTQYFSEEGVVYCVARDITERKEAEEERARLRGREQTAHAEAEAARTRLAAILDNLNEGVLVASQEGRMLFANPAARAMMDTISSEMPEDLPNPWEDFHLPNAVTRCAQNRENIEARVQYGETFLRVRLECPADLDNRGDVLVVIQDLSEGHRLEANQQRFLANAAHQLRTPIMAILGAAELLVTGDYEDPTVRRSLLNHIFAEGNRMKRLSEVLLHLSRIGWDSRNPNPESVSLRKAGHHAAERIAPLAENMGLNILIEGDDHHVCADPEWLQDVLLALLNNAIKHSHQGSEIKLRIHNGAIIVEDEGDGISSDDLPYIFERFYRGDEGPEGFGLGLLICRELTERMGGMISVTSHEEVGTAVKIELPEAHIIDD